MTPLKKICLKPEETKTNSVMNKKKVPINATKSKAKLEFNKTLTIELGRVGDEIAKMLSESEHMNVDIPTPSLEGDQKKIPKNSKKRKVEENIQTDPKPKKRVGDQKKILKDSKKKKTEPNNHKLLEAISETDIQADPKPIQTDAQKKLLQDSKKKTNFDKFRKIEPVHPSLFDAVRETKAPINLAPKKKIKWEPIVLNTSMEVQNQNMPHENSKKSYDSKLNDIVNDLYFKVEFVEENKDEIEEIIEVEETNTSYVLHLSLDQTQNLQKGGSLFMKKGLIPLDFKVTKVFDKIDHSPNKDISKVNTVDRDINVERISSEHCSNSKGSLKNCPTTTKNEQIIQSTDLSKSNNQFVNNHILPTHPIFKGLNTRYLTMTKTLENDIDVNLPSSTMPKLIKQGGTSVYTKSLKNDSKNVSKSQTKKNDWPSQANKVQNITKTQANESDGSLPSPTMPKLIKEGGTSVVTKKRTNDGNNLSKSQTKKNDCPSQTNNVQNMTKTQANESDGSLPSPTMPKLIKQGGSSVVTKKLKNEGNKLSKSQTKKNDWPSQANKVQCMTKTLVNDIDGYLPSPTMPKLIKQGGSSVVTKKLKKDGNNLSKSQTKKNDCPSQTNNVKNMTKTLANEIDGNLPSPTVPKFKQGGSSVVTKKLKKDGNNLSKSQTKKNDCPSQTNNVLNMTKTLANEIDGNLPSPTVPKFKQGGTSVITKMLKNDCQSQTNNVQNMTNTLANEIDGNLPSPTIPKFKQGVTSVITKILKNDSNNLSKLQTKKNDCPSQAHNIQNMTKTLASEIDGNLPSPTMPKLIEQGGKSVVTKELKIDSYNLSKSQTKNNDCPSQANNVQNMTKTLTNEIDGNLPSPTIPKLIEQGGTSVIIEMVKNGSNNLSKAQTKKSDCPSQANNVQNMTKTLANEIDGILPSPTMPKLIEQGGTSVITKNLKNDSNNLSNSQTKINDCPSQANNVQYIPNATVTAIEETCYSTEDGFPFSGTEQKSDNTTEEHEHHEPQNLAEDLLNLNRDELLMFQIQKMNAEQLDENTIVTEQINTVTDFSVLSESNSLDTNNVPKWAVEVITITTVETIQKVTRL